MGIAKEEPVKLNDAVFGLLLTLLGAAVLVGIQGYPRIPGQPVGPALFPGCSPPACASPACC